VDGPLGVPAEPRQPALGPGELGGEQGKARGAQHQARPGKDQQGEPDHDHHGSGDRDGGASGAGDVDEVTGVAAEHGPAQRQGR
jgi:hypothetical protein